MLTLDNNGNAAHIDTRVACSKNTGWNITFSSSIPKRFDWTIFEIWAYGKLLTEPLSNGGNNHLLPVIVLFRLWIQIVYGVDCGPLWSIDKRLKETNKPKKKKKKKKKKKRKRQEKKRKKETKRKTLTTHAYSFHFLGQFLSLLLFLLLLLLSNTTPQGLVLGPLFGRFFLLPGGRLLEAPGLLQLQWKKKH